MTPEDHITKRNDRKILYFGEDLSLYKHLCEIAGFTSFIVTKRSELFELVQEHPFSILVCDISAPESGGKSLIVQLRQLPELLSTPIFAITSPETFFMPSGREDAYPDIYLRKNSDGSLDHILFAQLIRRLLS